MSFTLVGVLSSGIQSSGGGGGGIMSRVGGNPSRTLSITKAGL